jgi:putative ATPase
LELVTHEAADGTTVVLDTQFITDRVQQNLSRYDKTGEQHYDIASAFIKSIRGSDPNGAVYWLARMIEGGEDLKFIARRMVISASEDIGLANPNALLLATTAAQAAQMVGYPEARIILSQAAVYLATSAKSNSSYQAIGAAQQAVRNLGDLPVPLHLRNAPTKLMKQLDYGKNYDYSHDNPGNFAAQEYLPDELSGTAFFQPQENNSTEVKISQRMRQLWGDKYAG